jgi:intracellular sulfur oxidation DsrE/DsrF family protein
MNDREVISDERLNALIDNELDLEEKERLLYALSCDDTLQRRYQKLRQVKEAVIQSYQDVPQPIDTPINHNSGFNRFMLGFASAALLLIGVSTGWILGHQVQNNTRPPIETVSDIDPTKPKTENILLHISSTNETRVEAVLQKAEALLRNAQQKHNELRVEIVANSDGLNILRKGSPYTEEISSLSKQYQNIKFLACGIAKKTAALKEGKPIELLPEAKDIPAALDEILSRLKQGWTYVSG